MDYSVRGRPPSMKIPPQTRKDLYTILAAGACGASVVAVEPIPTPFESLQDNIRLNRLEGRVKARNMGAGPAKGELVFSAALDAPILFWIS